MSITDLLSQLRGRPLIRDTITTTGWSVIGRSAGFLIPFFLAAWFGVSGATDAFFFVYGIVLFLSGMFAPVLEGIIVPFIAEGRARGEDVGRFVGKVLGISGLGLIIIAGLFALLIKPILSVITRFDDPTLDLIRVLFIEITPLIILLVWSGILSGTLNSYKKFAFPAVSPAPRAIICLIIILLFKGRIGVHAIAAGYIGGEIIRLLILLFVLRHSKLLKLRLSLRLDPRLKQFIRTASYQTAGIVAVGITPIINKTMASWLGEGSVSVLYYAERLYMIPVTLLTAGLMVTILSHWSGRYYESGPERLRGDVRKAVKAVTWISLLITVLFFIFHSPIVRLAFGRGDFPQSDLPEVGWIWMGFLPGIVPYLVGIIYFQAHLTLKNTRILMQCGIYRSLLNIGLNLILMRIWGTIGIAISTSLISVFFLWFLRRKLIFPTEK